MGLDPCRPVVVEHELAGRGLIHGNTRIGALLPVLDSIGCSRAYVCVGPRGQETVVPQQNLALAKQIRSTGLSEAWICGCCRVSSVFEKKFPADPKRLRLWPKRSFRAWPDFAGYLARMAGSGSTKNGRIDCEVGFARCCLRPAQSILCNCGGRCAGRLPPR
jgi:hypothetical protein